MNFYFQAIDTQNTKGNARLDGQKDAEAATDAANAPDQINWIDAGRAAWLSLYRLSQQHDSSTTRLTDNMAIFEQDYINFYTRAYYNSYVLLMQERRRPAWEANMLAARGLAGYQLVS